MEEMDDLEPQKKKLRTPQEKKQIAYKKDHHNSVENPHLFRKFWPRKKARANQEYRHKINQMLVEVEGTSALEDLDNIHPEFVNRPVVRKWYGSTQNRKWVENRLSFRIYRTAWNYFKKPYNSELHRQEFCGFLTAITTGQKGRTLELAHFINQYLNPPEMEIQVEEDFGIYNMELRRRWLKAFFEDEPEWEQRVRGWVRNIEGG